MKKSNLTENNFETSHVTKTLVDNGYIERLPDNYNQELFLYTETLLKFIKSTQPDEWEKLKEQYPDNTEETLHPNSRKGRLKNRKEDKKDDLPSFSSVDSSKTAR